MTGSAEDGVAAVTFVVGTTAGGTGAHVRMLAAGLARRGTVVTVLGPSSAGTRFGFASLPGAAFKPVEFTGRPRPGDLVAIARLRRMLSGTGIGTGQGPAKPTAVVVHAHGLRAGALSAIALAGVRGPRRPGLVLTVHNAPPAGGAAALIYRLLERIVARSADQVLCVSPDLECRMRAAGARRVDRAVVAAPGSAEQATPPTPETQATPETHATQETPETPATAATPAALPTDRPVVLAVGRLAAQKGFGTLIEAAAAWRDLEPPPLLAITGDGPLAADLRARAAPLGDDVRFLGHRGDVPALLAAARVFVLPSQWEGQPLVLQEALRAGAAIVATRVGGIPAMTGEDGALLVEPGHPAALSDAVRAVLTNPALAARLRAAARERAAALPGEDDAVAAALASYATARSRSSADPANASGPGKC